MNAVDRFVRIVQGEPVDRVPVVGVTSVVTVDLMRRSRNPLAGRPPRPRAHGSRRGGRPRPLRPGIREGAFRHGRGGGSPGGRHRLRGRGDATQDSYAAVLDSGRIGIRRRHLDARPLPRGPGSHPDRPKAIRRHGPGPLLDAGPLHALGLSFRGGDALDLDDRGAGQGAGGHGHGHPSRRPVRQGAIRGRRACGSSGRADGVRRPHLAGAIPGARGAVPSRAGVMHGPSAYHPHLRQHHPPSSRISPRSVSAASASTPRPTFRRRRTHLKGKAALIGYVPTGLLREGSPAEVRAAARQCIAEGVDALNAGCAVAPDTPIDNIKAMIAAAQQPGKGNQALGNQANRYYDPERSLAAVIDPQCSWDRQPPKRPLKTVSARRRAKRRVRRTSGTPQRARESANAADGPFSAACHQRPYFLNTSSMLFPARSSSFMLRSAW